MNSKIFDHTLLKNQDEVVPDDAPNPRDLSFQVMHLLRHVLLEVRLLRLHCKRRGRVEVYSCAVRKIMKFKRLPMSVC